MEPHGKTVNLKYRGFTVPCTVQCKNVDGTYSKLLYFRSSNLNVIGTFKNFKPEIQWFTVLCTLFPFVQYLQSCR